MIELLLLVGLYALATALAFSGAMRSSGPARVVLCGVGLVMVVAPVAVLAFLIYSFASAPLSF